MRMWLVILIREVLAAIAAMVGIARQRGFDSRLSPTETE